MARSMAAYESAWRDNAGRESVRLSDAGGVVVSMPEAPPVLVMNATHAAPVRHAVGGHSLRWIPFPPEAPFLRAAPPGALFHAADGALYETDTAAYALGRPASAHLDIAPLEISIGGAPSASLLVRPAELGRAGIREGHVRAASDALDLRRQPAPEPPAPPDEPAALELGARGALLELAEAEAAARSFSSYQFALPDDAMERCVALLRSAAETAARNDECHAPGALLDRVKYALGKTRGERYGERVCAWLDAHCASLLGAARARKAPPPPRSQPPQPLCDVARRIFDAFHRRSLVEQDPRAEKLRVVRAPAGGGKSTLLLDIARNWPALRFLLVTFSRDLCDEMCERIERTGVRNVGVSTFDSYCKRRNEETGVQFSTSMGDTDIVRAALPNCRFGRIRGSGGVGDIMCYAMNSCVRGPVSLCEKHRPVEFMVNGGLREHGFGGVLRNSFAGCRHRAFVGALDGPPAPPAGVDVILVDEVQDLTSQAVLTLERTGVPLVVCGDPLQEIFSFGDDNTCDDCKGRIAARSDAPYRTGALASADAIRLYSTFRLDAQTCRKLEEWTKGEFQAVSRASERPETAPADGQCSAQATITFTERLPPPTAAPTLLVLCRTNREVMAIALSSPDMLVVQGAQLATEVRVADEYLPPLATGKEKRKRYTAIQRLVIEKREEVGGAEALAAALEERAITLDRFSSRELAGDSIRAVCTVHRAKGFEAENVAITCAVFESLHDAAAGERNVGFVGASRHRGRLFVVGSDGRPRRQGAGKVPKKRRV